MVLFLLPCTVGCTTMYKTGINMSGPWVTQLLDNIKDSGSARLVKEGISSQVILVTALTEMSPDNIRFLRECSFLYCSYAMFIEDDDPEFAKELYTIGQDYGMRALKQNRKFRKGLEEGKPIAELVGFLGKKYAPALCWTALNGGFRLILNLDDPMVMFEMADIVAMAKRSTELDETYFYGASMVFMASYYGMIPEFVGLGGGPKASSKAFKEAREISDGKFLLADLFEARFLAVTINDKKLFKEKLKTVLDGDSKALEGGQLLNELAKMKARIYLEKQEKYF